MIIFITFKVLNSNSEPSTSDIPVGRISVMFYGTKETAFMKPSDLFPYLETRHQFEVPRKHKVSGSYNGFTAGSYYCMFYLYSAPDKPNLRSR